MKKDTWVFLRSAHEGKQERTGLAPSDSLSDCDDLWTYLFAMVVKKADVRGIVLRVGDPYVVNYGKDLIEFRSLDLNFPPGCESPDLIFNRGGYRDYLPYLNKHQDVPSVYIGCGRRWNPEDEKWSPWMKGVRRDLVLVDSESQKRMLVQDHSEVFPKPALDHLFWSEPVEKQFDLVFICHTPREIKGGKWLASRIPDGTSVLVVGPEDGWLRKESVSGRIRVRFTGKVPRRLVRHLACQARVGVVCDDGKCDSGPRVLPEYLAMGIPVIVRECVRAHLPGYVTSETGIVVIDDPPDFGNALRTLIELGKLGKLNPREVYWKKYRMNHAADRLVRLVESL